MAEGSGISELESTFIKLDARDMIAGEQWEGKGGTQTCF